MEFSRNLDNGIMNKSFINLSHFKHMLAHGTLVCNNYPLPLQAALHIKLFCTEESNIHHNIHYTTQCINVKYR